MNSQLLRKILTYSQQIEQSDISKATENLSEITNKHDLITYFPDQELEPGSPVLQADSFLCESPGRPT